MPVDVDILEDSIARLSPELLNILLKDHTRSSEDIQRNIFWATSDYECLGTGYQYGSPILPELITGANEHVIMPRVLKSRDTQAARSRDMAEVFTPSWICNAQNNLIDGAWFGKKDAFNVDTLTDRDATAGVQIQGKSNSRRAKTGKTMSGTSAWKSPAERLLI